MPMLDVADLLDDPDFCQTIIVTRMQDGTDGRGEATVEKTTFEFHGIVVPITSQELLRLPDAERLSGGISLYSRFNLLAGDGALSADEIIANNKTYTVVSVDDWGAFGAGFSVARCALLALQNED
ncbi:hypothetical protein QE368_000881 [Asaia bogorensis NBRC 16594]|nr:hypothetical protein [Asaia bogorensis NBRC 16594]